MKKKNSFTVVYHSPSFSMSLVQQPIQPLTMRSRTQHISYSTEFNPARYITMTARKKDPPLSFR